MLTWLQYILEAVVAASGRFAKEHRTKLEITVLPRTDRDAEGAVREAKRQPFALEGDANTAGAGPDFAIEGAFDSVVCELDEPLTGRLRLVRSDAPLRSIELQLMRVEEVPGADSLGNGRTEVQNIQVADFVRGSSTGPLEVPLWMVFPKNFTCSSIKTSSFSISFEVNIVVLFESGLEVKQSFPLYLYRAERLASATLLREE